MLCSSCSLVASNIAKRLTDAEIQERLGQLEGWTLEGEAIHKQYTLGGFPDAIAFVTRLAFDAEAAKA